MIRTSRDLLRRAITLYKRYKTDTAEYRRLAEALHEQDVGALNRRIWHILAAERNRRPC